MRATHMTEAAHHFSSYAHHHPFQFAAETTLVVLLLLGMSNLMIQAGEPLPATPLAAEASVEPVAEASAKWVWTRRVDRGGLLFPVGP